MITHAISSPFLDKYGIPLIQRLPDEILPIIFRGTKAPLTVSHVCRGWRTIALSDPYLWTPDLYVDHRRFYMHSIGSTNILNLYLTRSRSAPLTVELDTCYVVGMEEFEEEEDIKKCNCMSNLKLIASHLYHIKKLKILCDAHYSCFDVALVLQEAFSIHQAPVLESLEYSTCEHLWANDYVCYPQTAPALRFLRLMDAVIPWNAPIFQNLTELYINIQAPPEFEDGGRLMEIHELFGTLRACPNLTILFLRSCLPQHSLPSNDSSVISLPFIAEIFLWDLHMDTYLLITRHIKVSPLASWYIQDNLPSEASFQSICALVQDIGTQIDISQPREMTVVFQNNVISLFSSHFVRKTTDFKTSRKSVFTISFKLSQQDELVSGDLLVSRMPILQKVAEIVSAMNVNNSVIKLVVRFKDDRYYSRVRGNLEYVTDESVAWTEPFLLALPKLEHLGIKLFCNRDKSTGDVTRDELYFYKKGFLEGAVQALAPVKCQAVSFYSQKDDSDSKRDIICPNLRELEIAHGYGFLSEHLKRCLKSRSEHSSPIRSVKLTWSENPFTMWRIMDEWVDEARKVSDSLSIEAQPEREYWDRVFKPKHAHPGDDSNGSLRGYFEYDI